MSGRRASSKSNKSTKSGKSKHPRRQSALSVTSTRSTVSKAGKNKQLKSIFGIIHYQLSNPLYIELGWTKLPLHKMTSFLTKPWTCFRKRPESKLQYYAKGQLAAKFEPDGTGNVYYHNGDVAIKLSDSNLAGQRVILYSERKEFEVEDESSVSEGSTVEKGINSSQSAIAWFDSYGNAVIYDEEGHIKMNYNLVEGIMYETQQNRYIQWQWYSPSKSQKKFKHLSSVRKMESEQSKIGSDSLRLSISALKSTIPVQSRSTVKSQHSKARTESRDATSDLTLLKKFVLRSHRMYSLDAVTKGKSLFCKVNDNITLIVSNQEKIDLAFISHGVIIRFDLGMSVGYDKLVQANPTSNIDDSEKMRNYKEAMAGGKVKSPDGRKSSLRKIAV